MAPPMIQPRWPTLLHFTLILSVAVAQMPYNPTRVLYNRDQLYMFQPSFRSSTQFQLGSVDLSSRVDSSSLPYTTLYPTLPFLDDKILRPFTPVLDDEGNLTVYTGNCSKGASGGEVWSYNPAAGDKFGSWLKQGVSVASSKNAAAIGANYLSHGISFSSIVGSAANTGAYIFGGMCPIEGDSSSNWQSAANYSNFMVTLEPFSKDSVVTHQINVSPSRGPPIPEAGFTMTGLSPTYANRTDGYQTKQQNFVLIGGHTNAAFINMSQIALFSLPEQGWSFISVQQPDALYTNLTTRDITTIDPRSGHTAVLSSDGQQIIIYGGWVGDTGSPAEPQLAILNIADGYGGNGSWQWVVPATPSGFGLSGSSGLYGHGAVMLPGSVMMVTGGYSIATPSSQQRRTVPTANTKTYFLNVTSNAWITHYSPPPGFSDSQPTPTGPLSSPGQKAGLGVGIGIGLAAICGLFAFYMWYARRLKKQRNLREKQLHDLSLAAHRYNIEDYSTRFDDRGGQADVTQYFNGPNGSYYFPPGYQGGQGLKTSHGQDAERTGLLEVLSPTQGLRRSLGGPPIHSASTVRGPGQIHPIDELEEEDEEEEKTGRTTDKTPLRDRHGMRERREDQTPSMFDTATQLDHFTDLWAQSNAKKIAYRSMPSSPTIEENKYHEDLTTEWPEPSSAATTRRSDTVYTGQILPDKSISDERTSSNLSESSTRSNLSWTSSHGSLVRSTSVRAAAVPTATQSNPFPTPDASLTHNKPRRYSGSGLKTPADMRNKSSCSVRSNGRADIDSFRTAQTSYAHLQAEGEVLLGGNPERIPLGTLPTSNDSNSHIFSDTETSKNHTETATPATSHALDMPRIGNRDSRKSWLGSMRRVLKRSISGADRTRSLTTSASYHEPYTDNPVSPVDASVSDNPKLLSNVPPRRAASDASFWRSRRGKQDWEEELENGWRRNSGDDWGAPEDIARAEKDRLRQEWRERGNLLVNLTSDDELPTPRTPIQPNELGIPNLNQRPCTPADEGDWDVEAAVERRVVQVMFTVPKSKLRVVNADPDGSSILSLPRENSRESTDFFRGDKNGSSSRVKDLAGKFEQMSNPKVLSLEMTPRATPVPSPSPSVRNMKIRDRRSTASLKQSAGWGEATIPSSGSKVEGAV